jgi:CYTH domain-containing protein
MRLGHDGRLVPRPDTMNERPLLRDYARLELERRFVLPVLPAAIDPGAFTRLRDLFVDGAGLRVRSVESPAGDVLVVKLGQKRPDPAAPMDPRHRRLTTIYLTAAEAAPLLALPGRRSTKRRYQLTEQGRPWAIDVWEQPTSRAGLVMAEVECDSDAELAAVQMPAWARAEVTEDPAYSAFVLAGD